MQQLDTLLRRPFILGWELRHGIETLAHHLCAGLDLPPVKVQWNPGIATAGINASGDLLLSAVRDDARITRPTLVRYVGYVIHELLHRKYTNFAEVYSITGPNADYRRHLLNAVEDARIERTAIRSGLLGNVEGVLHDLAGMLVTEALAEVKDWSDPMQYPFEFALNLRQYPGLEVPMPQALADLMPEALRRLDKCQDTAQALDLSDWIYSQLNSLPENKPGKPCENSKPEQGKPGQGKPEQGNSKPEQGEGKGAPEQGKPGQGAESGQEKEGAQGQGQGSAEGQEKGQGQEKGSTQGQEKGQGSTEGTKEGRPQARRPSASQEAREVEPNLGGGAENEGTEGGAWCKERSVIKNGAHTNGIPQPVTAQVPARLRYEVRRLFENTAHSQHLNNRKNGRLNPLALARVDTTPNVFRKRLDVEGVDSAVVILLDLSFSMYDHSARIGAAIPATHALADTLTAAGVNVSVVTFDKFASVAVPFDTPRRQVLDTITRIKGGRPYTNDFAALRLAHDTLLRRPERRKVVFVISDGVGNWRGMVNQVAAGTRLGITTLGVGIDADVKRIYGANAVRVDKPQDLGNAAFSRMKIAA